MTSAAVELADTFARLTGRSADGVWSAPGRVNLIGDHTDYSDGYVLPFAIDARARVAAAARPDDSLRLWSLQQPGPVVRVGLDEIGRRRDLGWGAYVAGSVWALREAGVHVPGLDVVVDSSVPVGAGLSSSAALLCATALAAASLARAEIDPLRLALLGQRAENVVVGVPCGVMDHVVSMLAQPAHALFLDTRALRVEHVPLAPERHQLTLVVIDTRVRHSLASGDYADRRAATERIAQALGVRALRDVTVDTLDDALHRIDDEVWRRRLRHVATENQRVLDVVALLRADRLAEIGPLLTQSHASLRDDYDVSVAALDDAVGAATSAGAIGARMTGGGFGGSVVALVPTGQVRAVDGAVTRAAMANGHPTPALRVVTPAGGAADERR